MKKGCWGNIVLRLIRRGNADPIYNAVVRVGEGNKIKTLLTDTDGRAEFKYPTPSAANSFIPEAKYRPYSLCDISINAPDYKEIHIKGCQVFEGVDSCIDIELNKEITTEKKLTKVIPVHLLWLPKNKKINAENKNEKNNAVIKIPQDDFIKKYENIPHFLTVHCGRAEDEAQDKKIGFCDYIMNVSSGLLYPTWPEAALRANILAIITFVLNKMDYYRSQGFSFDIAAEPDGSINYFEERMIFEPIHRITEKLMGCYITKKNNSEPLIAEAYNEQTKKNSGLPLWESIELAESGLDETEILKHFYGNDIFIELYKPVCIAEVFSQTLKKGCADCGVKILQQSLNRIAMYYPAIPVIRGTNGRFDNLTETAVKAYQRNFGLPVTGTADKNTWRSVNFVCSRLKKYAENTERYGGNLPKVLVEGDEGGDVLRLQHYINGISRRFGGKRVLPVIPSGSFDNSTRESITAYQKLKKLPLSGVADKDTWLNIIKDCESFASGNCEKKKYPGTPVGKGSEGENVIYIQNAVNAVKNIISGSAELAVDGIYGQKTKNAVSKIQSFFGLLPNGIADEKTWKALTREYSQIGITAVG